MLKDVSFSKLSIYFVFLNTKKQRETLRVVTLSLSPPSFLMSLAVFVCRLRLSVRIKEKRGHYPASALALLRFSLSHRSLSTLDYICKRNQKMKPLVDDGGGGDFRVSFVADARGAELCSKRLPGFKVF